MSAPGPGRRERLEETPPHLLVDARAIVGHLDRHPPRCRRRGDDDPPVLTPRACLDGVHQHVQQRMLQVILAGRTAGSDWESTDVRSSATAERCAPCSAPRNSMISRRETGLARLDGAGSAENAIEQFDRADQVPGDLADGVFRGLVVRFVLLVHQVGEERECLAGVAKIVNQPAGDLPVHRGAVDGCKKLGRVGHDGGVGNPLNLLTARAAGEPRSSRQAAVQRCTQAPAMMGSNWCLWRITSRQPRVMV